MSDKAPGNRFGWLKEEEELGTEGVRRPQAPTQHPGEAAELPADRPMPASGAVPGVTRRRRRNRPKNPNALRNDPRRMMAGARIRKDVRRRVEQALADPAVVGEEGTNYSLLVESLLVGWLREVGYAMKEE